MENRSQTISDEAIQKATGKLWSEWFAILHDTNAHELSHQDIAVKLSDEHHVSGWWAQTITVEFERLIGRREVGQSSAGDYQASASKTLPGTMDDVLAMWQSRVNGMTDFDGTSFVGEPSVSKTDNWRYWRVTLDDGSKVALVIGAKSTDKALLAVNHEKLPDAQAIERWKVYWKDFLRDLAN